MKIRGDGIVKSPSLVGNNERDLVPNLEVFGCGVEFDHLPCLRLDLDAVGERIHRSPSGWDWPAHLARGAAGIGPLLRTRLDVDHRLGGDMGDENENYTGVVGARYGASTHAVG
jgi:hypothetical protein